jgi:hypothetical protein
MKIVVNFGTNNWVWEWWNYMKLRVLEAIKDAIKKQLEKQGIR